MKNKYNNTKSSLDGKIRDLSNRNSEAEGVLSMQKGEVDKLHEVISTHRKQVGDRKNQFKDKLSE